MVERGSIYSNLAEMKEKWTYQVDRTQVMDSYWTELSLSSTKCTHPPETFQASEIKKAYWSLKQSVRPSDILEIEVPFYFLQNEDLRSLERLPEEGEVVLLMIDKRTGGHSFIIADDLPGSTPKPERNMPKK